MANADRRTQNSRRRVDTVSASNMGRPNHPPWLKLEKQIATERNYKVCAKRAAAVLWMFQASANGLIDSKIAEMIPKRFHPWAKDMKSRTIERILENKEVLGENQRHKMVNGQRRPVGKPQQNFFPPIVPSELFCRVQKARSLPRTGDLANLFAALARCECCDQRIKYRSRRIKGDASEGILCCNNKICPAYGKEWSYPDFEKMFMLFVKKINDRDLLKSQRLDDDAAINLEIRFLQDEVDAKRDEITQLRRRVGEINDEIAELRGVKRELRMAGVAQRQTSNDYDYRLRSRKAARIRESVSELYVAVAGTTPRMPERIELIRKRVKSDPDITQDLIEDITDLKDKPYLIARFEGGKELVCIPSKDDPDDVELSKGWGTGKSLPAKPQLCKDVLPPIKLLLRFKIPGPSGGPTNIYLLPSNAPVFE